MSAAHTPGPWKVEACIWGGYPFRISGPGDSAGTAGMFSPALIMGDGTHNAGTAQANARLISAAPEMLEALKDAPKTNHPADERGPCLCSACAFSRRALDLIARAEGKA